MRYPHEVHAATAQPLEDSDADEEVAVSGVPWAVYVALADARGESATPRITFIDGVIDLGYDVVHPWQESAGMSLEDYKANYRGQFVVMGGLDVQSTIGFGKLDFLTSEIERVMRLFADGGLLYCTSHFVQDHCSMEELTVAFDTVYELSRTVSLS